MPSVPDWHAGFVDEDDDDDGGFAEDPDEAQPAVKAAARRITPRSEWEKVFMVLPGLWQRPLRPPNDDYRFRQRVAPLPPGRLPPRGKETPMRSSRSLAALAFLVSFSLPACSRKEASAVGTPAAAVTAAPKSAASEKPAPYSYPAPVKGHLKDVNTGDFDLVDGVAFPATGDAGTVVYMVSKPIASPVISGSPCPMTAARALTVLRNAGWVEVTLDARGRSKYFGKGTPYTGSGREDETGGNRYWSSELKAAGGRAAGKVSHKDHGGFEFDLPVSSPRIREVSEGDRAKGKQGDESSPVPTEAETAAAYQTVREAALRKDLRAVLAAQGFDEKQIAAIRGLNGIDADLAAFSEHFLEPGTTGEFQNGPGTGGIVGTGANSKGAKFLNYYTFAPCNGKLVLSSIGENPQ